MDTIRPFENEAESLQIEELTIENRLDRISIYGNLEITRDKAGLNRARQLQRILADTVRALEQADEQLFQVMTGYHQVMKQLKGKINLALANSMADLKFQMEHLVYPGFLTETPPQWLACLPRYFEAADIRLEKMPREMGREREFLHIIDPLWRRYQQKLEQQRRQGIGDPELTLYRWMLEEFRVSWFAQQLGTAMPVSTKRLDHQWEKVRQ